MTRSPAFTLHWRHNGHDDISNHQPHDCLLNRLLRRRSKKTSKLRVTGLWAGNSPVTAQMASNAQNVSISWRHHVATWWLGVTFINRILTWIPAWISNHFPSGVWAEITVDFWEWNYFPHYVMDVIMPFFRVRPWNNCMRCMSSYIPSYMDVIFYFCWDLS